MSDSRRSSRPGGRPTRRAAGMRASGPSSSRSDGASKGSSRTGRAASGGAAAGKGSAAKGSSSRGSGAKGSSATGSAAKGSAAQRRSSSRKKTKAGAKAAVATNFLNYPRAGKSNPWRWIPSFRLIAGAFALLVLLGVGGAAWLYATTDVPEPDQVALAQTSTVYYVDGKTEMGKFSDINRTILPSDEIPQNVKDAVVASEDSTFYENRGISPKGILRAFVNNVRGGAQQGGSTITQQYVERYYTGTTTSYSGKVREMIMAMKIDQELPKDEILARYLNTIYFGRSAYGVQAASQAYFGKDASELTDAEAALLVAVIPAPSTYDPANNPQKSAALWDRVIEREVNATGALTPAQAKKLEFPDTIKQKTGNVLGGPHGYLLMIVRSEMKKQGFTEEQINTGGYSIVSTFRPDVQKNVEQAVKNLPDDRPKHNHVGIATVDPHTGAVRGMYGGADYVEQPRNDATESRMQAGSIFKTFTLIAALKSGYSLYSTFDGNSPASFPGWPVKNFGDTSYGQISLKEATTHSVNTAYAQLNLEIGPKKTEQTAIQLGLPKNTPGLDDQASNVLGSASPTVLEMAGVYSTVADQGIHHATHTVKTVRKSDGSIAYKHKDSSRRVIDKDVAINATVALQGPPTEGSARYVGQNMDRPVAGKTGTSSSFKSAWFVGFTPQLVTAVGMFQPSEDGRVEEQLTPFGGVESMTGGQWPARIWVDVMEPSLEGQEVLDFPPAVQLDNQRTSDSDRASSSAAANRTTEAPPATTEAPTTEEPTTEEPTTEEPTTEEPSDEPTTTKPTSDKPTSEKPPSDKPSTKRPSGGDGAGKPTERPGDEQE